MKTFQTNIDKLVSKILNEEIDSKFEEKFNNKSENFEELIGNQSKIDVADPKGKITAADFKKLRNSKYNKKEVEEYFDNEDDFDYEDDNDDYDDFDDEDDTRIDYSMGKTGDNQMPKPPKYIKLDIDNEYEDNNEDDYENNDSEFDELDLDDETDWTQLKERKLTGNDNILSLGENELIDMIEKIVLEQKVKDRAETSNIAKKEAEGLKKTNKVLELDKKENDDYAKEVVIKMKDYMKDMFMGGKGYDENPDDFPQSNYDMEKDHNEMKKYNPSDAVDEYIEAFSYPGMTNLVYDEIKPDDEMISNQIKGNSKNGNAVTSKDGKALGNVSKRSEKTGDRFKKNFDENLYGAEQMNVSYNRQSQPVDIAGSKTQKGSLKSIKSNSTDKAENILNQLESSEVKTTKIINEDLQKMKDLISYNRKTQ
jgi:ElaB/YqjD/DUF883 family membrane-anchored ribosome-binding protein